MATGPNGDSLVSVEVGLCHDALGARARPPAPTPARPRRLYAQTGLGRGCAKATRAPQIMNVELDQSGGGGTDMPPTSSAGGTDSSWSVFGRPVCSSA